MNGVLWKKFGYNKMCTYKKYNQCIKNSGHAFRINLIIPITKKFRKHYCLRTINRVSLNKEKKKLINQYRCAHHFKVWDANKEKKKKIIM